MSTRKPTTLGIADEISEIKRLSWAIASAADGVPSQEPAVQGIAHIATILIERIEALETKIGQLRSQEQPSAAA
jgi:hypothetical protein